MFELGGLWWEEKTDGFNKWITLDVGMDLFLFVFVKLWMIETYGSIFGPCHDSRGLKPPLDKHETTLTTN